MAGCDIESNEELDFAIKSGVRREEARDNMKIFTEWCIIILLVLQGVGHVRPATTATPLAS
jgi:hypothetical protein